MVQHQSIKNIYLDSIENPAYIVDTSGVLLDWNSKFCESFGLNDSDLIDKRLDQLLPETIHQNNIDVIAQKLSEFKILEIFETQHTSPELFYSHKQLVTDENGEILGLLSVSSIEFLKKSRDVLSWQTKHQLRELLNAMAGALENHKSDSDVATKSLNIKV